MKNTIHVIVVAALCGALNLSAQPTRGGGRGSQAPSDTGDYATDLGVVADAQAQALDQARQMLDSAEEGDHVALQNAVNEMERSQAALAAAKKTPDKLAEAVAAQQSAYQALLKALPREYNVQRSRNGQRGQRGGNNGQAGQPGQDELNQLELTDEDNRYETERQATTAPTQQQTEQAQTADRLKQLARRQQDLNERLRDLQTALQEARTDQQRQEAERQLKRLQEEQRQMLADTDELRQQMEQSPNASQQAQARQQLDQTRNDMERAAEQMDRQSVSEALASGSRATENLQGARDNLRQQSSSQFTQQMRQMQSQARDLADQEEKLSHDLNALNNSDEKNLDDTAQRRPIEEQMIKQEAALTNLVSQMRDMTEQAETTEPLLSKQIYDIVRREDQKRTDSQLDIGAQLVDRGFLPQAVQQESIARTNIDEMRDNIETAAQSILGSEADSLRFAQKELDDLASQLAREMGDTNLNSTAGGARAGRNRGNGQGGTNAVADNQPGARNGQGQGGQEQNADQNGRGDQANAGNRGGGRQGQRGGEGQQPGENGNPDQNGDQNGQGEQANAGNRGGGRQGQRQGQRGGGNPETARNGGDGQQPGENGNPDQNGDQNGQGEQANAGNRGGGRQGQRQGQRGGGNAETARNGGDGQAADDNGDQPGGQNGRGGGQRRGGQNARGGGPGGLANNDGTNQFGGRGGNISRDQLRNIAQQLGGAGGAGGWMGPTGPITGTNYIDWTDRLRDVEQTLDSQDLRNQLATVRERIGVYRQEYRQTGRAPTPEELQNRAIQPLLLARSWVAQELARAQKDRSLVPLDRDPVQDKYSDAVRMYYEKLGSRQ